MTTRSLYNTAYELWCANLDAMMASFPRFSLQITSRSAQRQCLEQLRRCRRGDIYDGEPRLLSSSVATETRLRIVRIAPSLETNYNVIVLH